MKIKEREWHLILIGTAFVLLGGYVAVSRTGAPGTGPSGMPNVAENPKRSLAAGSLNVTGIAAASGNLSTQGLAANVNMLGIDVNGGLTLESQLLHYFHPDGPLPLNPSNQQYTDCTHRYPTVTGTNISTLIHHGYSPLMVPSPQDYDWMVRPPTESYFGG